MEVSWAQRCRTTQTHEHIPPSCHSSQRARAHSILPSFIATGHHERIPSSRHSSQRARAHSILPSFPRRRESGCAIHEPFCECIQ